MAPRISPPTAVALLMASALGDAIVDAPPTSPVDLTTGPRRPSAKTARRRAKKAAAVVNS